MSVHCFKNNNCDDMILTLKSISVLAWVCFRLYWPSNHAALWQLHQLQPRLWTTTLLLEDGLSIHHYRKGSNLFKKALKAQMEFQVFFISCSKINFKGSFQTHCWGLWWYKYIMTDNVDTLLSTIGVQTLPQQNHNQLFLHHLWWPTRVTFRVFCIAHGISLQYTAKI